MSLLAEFYFLLSRVSAVNKCAYKHRKTEDSNTKLLFFVMISS